jgi:hypothetical protein
MVEHYAAALALPPVPAQPSWLLTAFATTFPSGAAAAAAPPLRCVMRSYPTIVFNCSVYVPGPRVCRPSKRYEAGHLLMSILCF